MARIEQDAAGMGGRTRGIVEALPRKPEAAWLRPAELRTRDKGGEPILHYWPSRLDRYRLTRGMQEMVRIAFAGGAVGAATLHTPRLDPRSEKGRPGAVTCAQLDRYLDAISRAAIAPNRVPLFSAHQMGSCRLGADRRIAVADPYGEVYGMRGLYIADASGFPTASGVNPMISIMALAYHVAQSIKAQV